MDKGTARQGIEVNNMVRGKNKRIIRRSKKIMEDKRHGKDVIMLQL